MKSIPPYGLGLLSIFINVSATIFDCSGGVDGLHLEHKIPYKSCFHDGQGVYVSSINVTHPYSFPTFHECWDDLYVVHAAPLRGLYEPATSPRYTKHLFIRQNPLTIICSVIAPAQLIVRSKPRTRPNFAPPPAKASLFRNPRPYKPTFSSPASRSPKEYHSQSPRHKRHATRRATSSHAIIMAAVIRYACNSYTSTIMATRFGNAGTTSRARMVPRRRCACRIMSARCLVSRQNPSPLEFSCFPSFFCPFRYRS
jgi:hypothetical protein